MRSNCIPMKRIWTLHLFVFSFILILRHVFFTNMSQTREYVWTSKFFEKKNLLWFVMAHTHLRKCHHQKKSITSDEKRRLTFIEWYHSVIHGLLQAHYFKIRRIDIDIESERENLSECLSVNIGHWTHFYERR